MAAQVTERDVGRWSRELERVAERIGPRFGRPELRARAPAYLKGLIASIERKNGWQLAEFAGDATPTNLQHFIGRAKWDAGAVRDDLVRYVAEHLGEPDGVLIVDETGFLKKGIKSAGVGRMYSGTAGRIENCQIGVFCAYRSAKGQTLVDRELYLPRDWIADRSRCRAVSLPDEVEFATNEYEVRSWSGWQRHVTLSMFAHAMLAVIRAKALRRRKHPVGKKGAQH